MGDQSPEEISDQQILQAFQSEDKKALQYLYHKYLHVIYGVCLKYLHSKEEAQDATSDLFEKFNDINIPEGINNLKSWIYVVSKNHCLMQLRKKKEKTISLSPHIVMEYEVEMHPIDKELKAQAEIDILLLCIKALKNEQKSCVELFYLSKFCYQDIVDKTGFELKKVKSYIQNGKRNLKICIESKGQ